MIDPEMQALLSGHAAGTLTPEEKKRLHEAALNNQAIFDAMEEEEPLRAALTSSLAKQGLLRALEKIGAERGPVEISKSNTWLWAALAACLVVGAATVAYWPTTKQETEELAIATKPKLISEPILQPMPKPAPKVKTKTAAAPVAIAESTQEKREAKSVEQPEAPAAAAAADSARRERKSTTASNSFRQSPLSAPQMSSANPLPPVQIFNDNLLLRADDDNQIYAFLVDGESIKPLSTNNESRRIIPLGDHSTKAEVWLIITGAEDPVLARALTGVLPLPARNWIKVRTNP